MAEQTIDLVELQKLCDKIGGDHELLRELVDDFVDELPQQIEAMTDALEPGDWKKLHIEAHSLKSDAKSLGAIHLGKLCAGLELQCRQGVPEDAESVVAQITEEAKGVIIALQSIDSNEL